MEWQPDGAVLDVFGYYLMPIAVLAVIVYTVFRLRLRRDTLTLPQREFAERICIGMMAVCATYFLSLGIYTKEWLTIIGWTSVPLLVAWTHIRAVQNMRILAEIDTLDLSKLENMKFPRN